MADQNYCLHRSGLHVRHNAFLLCTELDNTILSKSCGVTSRSFMDQLRLTGAAVNDNCSVHAISTAAAQWLRQRDYWSGQACYVLLVNLAVAVSLLGCFAPHDGWTVESGRAEELLQPPGGVLDAACLHHRNTGSVI